MLIICNGMIRSGSTLQYNMARLLVTGTQRGRGHGFFSRRKLHRLNRIGRWSTSRSHHVIKMHDLLDSEDINRYQPRFLYIYRDIRDVAASLKLKYNRTGEDLLRSTDRAMDIYDQIRVMPNVLWQQYEKIMSDLASAIDQIATFLEIEISDEIRLSIAQECSLDNQQQIMRNLEKGLLHRMKKLFIRKIRQGHFYDSKTLLHDNHISKNLGTPGSWRHELDLAESELLQSKYKDWLQEHGYSILP